MWYDTCLNIHPGYNLTGMNCGVVLILCSCSLPKLLSIHPVWRINLLLHCLESFSCTDLFLLMDFVTVAEARFPVYTWECVLIQFLKGRLAYHLELVSLPQLPIATNNPVRDSVEDVMEVTDNEIHEEGTVSA